MGYIIIIICFLAVIAFVYINQSNQKEFKELKERGREVKAEYEEKLKTIIIPAYNQSRTDLINRNGNPTKVFILGKYNLSKEIIAFEESKRIWICGNDFLMKSILSCTFTDNKNVIKGQITSTTKTNSSNMIKRAVLEMSYWALLELLLVVLRQVSQPLQLKEMIKLSMIILLFLILTVYQSQ